MMANRQTRNVLLPQQAHYVINDAITANEQRLCIRININGLHFKDNFKANNFDKVSTNPFSNAPATLAAASQNQNPNTPVTINDIANLIAAVSPGTAAAQQTSPLGGNQMQQTGNIINLAYCYLLKCSNNLKKVNNMTPTLSNKRETHSTPPFLISLSTLLETLWERCSISWMVLTIWSPGQVISSFSQNGMKRNKRCSSPGPQSLHQDTQSPYNLQLKLQISWARKAVWNVCP